MKTILSSKIKFMVMAYLAFACYSCKKLIEVDVPPTSTDASVVFSSDATAAAVMTGVYAQMNSTLTNVVSLSIYPELSVDNLTLFATNNLQYSLYYRNALSPLYTSPGPIYWNLFYPMIYNCNSVIEGVPKSTTLTNSLKNQLLGEAYFMRAFAHFYLVNLYGNIPLILSTSYLDNQNLGQEIKSNIYSQTINDLKNAQSLLNQDYVDATLLKTTTERLRPNKAAASALLARVYLYNGDNENAEIQSTSVINQAANYSVVPLPQTFLKNNKETIWALQPVRTGENTLEARFYSLPINGPNANTNPVYLSDKLLSEFESIDQRKTSWISSVLVAGKSYSYVSKYKIITQNAAVNEYSIVLRLAEQYLIRAEARAKRNNLSGSQSDLNQVRFRAGLFGTNAVNEEQLLNAILKERRLELFTEWGHRWFDLKRTGKLTEAMVAVAADKEMTWKPEWQLYPVPALEIQRNPKLIQNNEYPK